MSWTRRSTLGAGIALGTLPPFAWAAPAAASTTATPFPLSQVRLKPSIFLTSVQANQRYLLSLDADRLLHKFYAGAGMPTKGEVYGGWESRGIAGHSLGHYLSAVSLILSRQSAFEKLIRESRRSRTRRINVFDDSRWDFVSVRFRSRLAG